MEKYTGLKSKVREYLSERDGTAQEIAAALNVKIRQVSQAMSELYDNGGLFRVDMKGARPVYSSTDPNRSKNLPMPYRPPFQAMTPESYDIRGHMKRAMLIR